jgi:hypothetical protein
MDNKLIQQVKILHEAVRFCKFMQSLNNVSNNNLLEAVYSGYTAIFEEPHTITVDDKLVDFHVEDVLTPKDELGETKHYEEALNYVTEIINAIENDETIHIPAEIIRKSDEESEATEVEHPQQEFFPWELNRLLLRLHALKNDFTKHLTNVKLRGY